MKNGSGNKVASNIYQVTKNAFLKLHIGFQFWRNPSFTLLDFKSDSTGFYLSYKELGHSIFQSKVKYGKGLLPYSIANTHFNNQLKIDNLSSDLITNNLKPPQAALLNAIIELNNNAKSDSKYSGEFVKKYNSIVNLGAGQPWAATFVSWCYNNKFKYFEPNANISQLENYFYNNSLTFKIHDIVPQPGDIYFYDYKANINGRAVGIVEYYSKEDNILIGIEGNSNEHGVGPNIYVARVWFSVQKLSNEKFLFARIKL